LSGRLRDGRVGDMADLASAVRFVVGVPVEVRDNLHAQRKYRHHQRYGQQPER